ncbi:MlaD family protein [Nocardia sp. NPDC048505]|uniref:MlaD family protein n=1 Tax=Nocardia sp. NPDC048505 TaxID=3155756 RepID=UPI0033DDA142
MTIKQRLARLGRVNDALTALRLPPLDYLWESIPRYSANRHWWLGLGAGAAVLALLVGSSALNRLDLGQHTVHAEFAQAAGLRDGDSVDIAGIEVGTVKSARPAGDRIEVALSIRDDIGVHTDATAEIKMSTILGRMHVELDPGSTAAPAGDRIGLERTKVPYSLAKVVNDSKYTQSFEHLERLDPAALRAALDALARQMGDSPRLTAQALDSVGALAEVISDRRDEVARLLQNIDAVSRVVSDNQNAVLLLLTRGQAIGDAVVRRQHLVTQLLDNIALVSKNLREMGIEDNGGLAPLIADLNTMSAGLQKNKDNLDNLFQIMPVTLRQFNNSLGNGPYGEVYLPWLFPDNWLCATDVVAGCR